MLFYCWIEISNQEINVLFNDQITESIRWGTAVAALDASVKDYHMGGCWIIADINSQR